MAWHVSLQLSRTRTIYLSCGRCSDRCRTCKEEPKGAATDYFTRPPVIFDGGRQLGTVHQFGTSGTLKWYDTASAAELATTTVPLDSLRGVAVSPDGRLLALATGNSVNFDAKTRAPSRITGNVLSLAFSPKGNFFAFSSGMDVEVRSVQQGKIGSRAFPIVSNGGQAAFSSDGKYMAVQYRGLTQVLRLPRETRSIRLSVRCPSMGNPAGPDSHPTENM